MFDAYVRDHAAWSPRATAVQLRRVAVTYAEFDGDIDRVGAALAALGVTPDTGIVSVAIGDPYRQYLVTAALSRLGVASAPAVDDAADLRLSDSATAQPGPPVQMLSSDWFAAVFAAERRPLPALLPDPDALGRVMLSSGTTATPRRVAFSWRRLDLGNHATLHEYCQGHLGTWMPLTGIDSMMGLALIMGAWSVGAATANAIPMPDMPGWLERLPGGGILSLTPVQLRQLVDALPPGFRPPPRWRIVCGGAHLPRDLAEAARLKLTPDIRLLYGATEVGTLALGLAEGLDDHPGQIGITPSDAFVEVVDDNGRPVAPGELGEIRARGPRMAPGYLGDPEATAERFRDGWFYTRDLGLRLPDGRLVLEGRADDRMNLGGRKVMPGPLEQAALACPGVLDAAAFGVPDPDGLEACWLAVVAEPGFERDRLAEHLAGYADLPERRYAWTEELPRNAMGKVERTRLREAVLEATGRAPAPKAG